MTLPAVLVLAASVLVCACAAVLDRRRRRGCDHPQSSVHCLHGDEIVRARGHRSSCTACGRTFPHLPAVCSSTGRPHFLETY